MASDDPGFEEKVIDIVGLYTRRPVHVAAFCVDVKSAVQVLDLLEPCFPLSPGYASGALSLYNAFTEAEEVLSPTATRHLSREFVDFLAQIVMSQPVGRELRVLVTNSNAYKTTRAFEFLEDNPSVRIHYAPTYSSWVSQVEMWFSKIHPSFQSKALDVSSSITFVNTKRTRRRSAGFIRITPEKINRDNCDGKSGKSFVLFLLERAGCVCFCNRL
jgi:transposase